MWPFKKKPAKLLDPTAISYSQLDITERFGDNLSLKEQDWIQTVPLNERSENPQSMGLPPREASPDTIYAIAERMSRFRESIEIPSDGVYCPTCHIANISLSKLRTPCPKCTRPLLKFGWD
jgi:hypothetical protein